MPAYIDGFVLTIPIEHLEEYARVASEVAEIWKEYGALAYHEFVGDDLSLEGTRSFVDVFPNNEGNAIVFGWVAFPSKAVRDAANERVPKDPRMIDLVAPLTQPERVIFDAASMLYGGFKRLV